MRKLVVSVYSTLDGVIVSPEKWSWQFWNAEQGNYAHDLLFTSDALLLGRETYESFAAAWPARTSADDPPGAAGMVERINTMPKFVAATTLHDPLTWNNAHVLTGNVTEAVAELKQQPGQDIVMYGAGPLAYTLMQHHLVDDLQVWVHPVVWGNGGRLLGDSVKEQFLKLVGTQAFSSGVIVLRYQPMEAPRGK